MRYGKYFAGLEKNENQVADSLMSRIGRVYFDPLVKQSID